MAELFVMPEFDCKSFFLFRNRRLLGLHAGSMHRTINDDVIGIMTAEVKDLDQICDEFVLTFVNKTKNNVNFQMCDIKLCDEH